jgi:hypothetical protein
MSEPAVLSSVRSEPNLMALWPRHIRKISTQSSVSLREGRGYHANAVSPRATFLRRLPELNAVEKLWEFMRQNWLSNRVFESYDQIVALCCDAWNRLRDRPRHVKSIGRRPLAHA